MKNLLKLAALLGLVVTLMTGCAVNRATANVDPSTDLSSIKTMYVKKIPEDGRGINMLIADKLRSKGITVTTGTEPPVSNVEAVVTYIDKWMWDITMYMIQLDVQIRNPKTDDVPRIQPRRVGGLQQGTAESALESPFFHGDDQRKLFHRP